jgi:hypothetical protein
MPTRAVVDHLAALCDFVAGASMRSIAQRFGWTTSRTEAKLRRAFLTYGVSSASIPGLRPESSAGAEALTESRKRRRI